MVHGSRAYGRDLDLNLLRVFVMVAETGSVTAAASQLYLTQPAISAALKRLTDAVGAPLFARQGRGIVLTARGKGLLESSRPHLEALVDAALSPPVFDPRASERTIRIGLSDVNERWLLPALLRVLAREAPQMRLVVVPVQFRTVGAAFASAKIDLAVTVADDLGAGVRRRALFHGGFTCLYDPRHARVGKRLTRRRYFAHKHVIVSYNADLRGIVEDFLGLNRDARISVPSFHNIGALVEGTALLATIPETVAAQILVEQPKLRITPLPIALGGAPMEVLWRSAADEDPALHFVLDHIARIASDAFEGRA